MKYSKVVHNGERYFNNNTINNDRVTTMHLNNKVTQNNTGMYTKETSKETFRIRKNLDTGSYFVISITYA